MAQPSALHHDAAPWQTVPGPSRGGGHADLRSPPSGADDAQAPGAWTAWLPFRGAWGCCVHRASAAREDEHRSSAAGATPESSQLRLAPLRRATLQPPPMSPSPSASAGGSEGRARLSEGPRQVGQLVPPRSPPTCTLPMPGYEVLHHSTSLVNHVTSVCPTVSGAAGALPSDGAVAPRKQVGQGAARAMSLRRLAGEFPELYSCEGEACAFVPPVCVFEDGRHMEEVDSNAGSEIEGDDSSPPECRSPGASPRRPAGGVDSHCPSLCDSSEDENDNPPFKLPAWLELPSTAEHAQQPGESDGSNSDLSYFSDVSVP
mmetsp:Transcript_80732/g.261682  ORF Transcript_80732/g.261682 Transcript_80732/m.261682 type:complete len:317 (+) Transcript_80732:105-1055(+)